MTISVLTNPKREAIGWMCDQCKKPHVTEEEALRCDIRHDLLRERVRYELGREEINRTREQKMPPTSVNID